MKIIGIDPGIGIIGFGVVEMTTKPRLLEAGVIKTTIGLPIPTRLLELYESLNEVLTDCKPDMMAIEKLFFAQNVTTAISVAEARGVIELLGAMHGLTIHEYTPLQVKMALVGYGRATKMQIKEMVKIQLNLDTTPKPDDCADALAIAITHAYQARLGSL